MYCVYYNEVKISELRTQEEAYNFIQEYRPPQGVVIKVTKEELIYEYEVM